MGFLNGKCGLSSSEGEYGLGQGGGGWGKVNTHTHTFYSHINTSEIGMSLLMVGCVLYGRVPYIFTHTLRKLL